MNQIKEIIIANHTSNTFKHMSFRISILSNLGKKIVTAKIHILGLFVPC